jgi:hypothetical protein
MKPSEVLESTSRERFRLLAAVESLGGDADTLKITAEGWTAKDVLAHCIHWVSLISYGMGAPLTPPSYVTSAQGRLSSEEWNAMAVDFFREQTLADVRSQFERLVGVLENQVRLRDDSAMLATDAIRWSPGEPLWKLVGAETFLHWPEHADEIERAAAGRKAH